MINTYVTLTAVFITILFILWMAFNNHRFITKQNAKEEMYQHLIEQLWAIIDDIDTYGDMAKSDDKMFRRLVEARQKTRWNLGITSDGQGIQYDINNIPPAPFMSDAKEFAEGLEEIFEDEEHKEPAKESSAKEISEVAKAYSLPESVFIEPAPDGTVVAVEADDAPQDIHPIPSGFEQHKLGRTLVTHRRMFIMLAENQLQVCAPIDSTHYCSIKFENDEEFNCFAKKVE